jgi:N-methylhydantoinase A
MVNGIMQISTKIGYDVRDFTLLAFGGAGPLHAAFLAESLDIRRVIIPKFAASFCAWSMFTLDIGRGYIRSYISRSDVANLDTINQLFQEMIREAFGEFAPLNIPEKAIRITKSAEMKYSEQFYNIEIPLPKDDIQSKDIELIVASFHKKHEELYNFSMRFAPVEFRNFRILATTSQPKIRVKEIERGTEDSSAALKRKRLCFFNNGYIETPIYAGEKLKSGNSISGPAVIEEATTTVVVPRIFYCSVDEYGNYILRRK